MIGTNLEVERGTRPYARSTADRNIGVRYLITAVLLSRVNTLRRFLFLSVRHGRVGTRAGPRC